MGVLYTERKPESARVGAYLNWCFSAGIITDAQVAANATLTLLKAAVNTAILETQKKPIGIMLGKALDRGLTLGIFSETHGVVTVAALVALTDSGTTMKQGFFG